jgi:predicted nucleic acid-binding protein
VADAGVGVVRRDLPCMATAALRDGVVVTRDVRDFAALPAHFKGVRVIGRVT